MLRTPQPYSAAVSRSIHAAANRRLAVVAALAAARDRAVDGVGGGPFHARAPDPRGDVDATGTPGAGHLAVGAPFAACALRALPRVLGRGAQPGIADRHMGDAPDLRDAGRDRVPSLGRRRGR